MNTNKRTDKPYKKITTHINRKPAKCANCKENLKIGFSYTKVKEKVGDKHIERKFHNSCYRGQ